MTAGEGAGMTEGGWWAWRDACGEIAAASAGMTVEGVERVISVNRLWGLFTLYTFNRRRSALRRRRRLAGRLGWG